MNHKRATPEQRARWEDALRLYEQGYKQREIAALHHLSIPTVNRWIVKARKVRASIFQVKGDRL